MIFFSWFEFCCIVRLCWHESRKINHVQPTTLRRELRNQMQNSKHRSNKWLMDIVWLRGGGGSRLRTERADICSAWVNDRRAGLRHSLMGNDFSAPPGIEHWSPTLSHLALLRPWRRSGRGWMDESMRCWAGFARPSWLSPFFVPVWLALCCRRGRVCQTHAGATASTPDTQIQNVFMSFYCGLFASHIFIHCTNGRIVLISYKNVRFDSKQGHKVHFMTLNVIIGTI